MKKFELTKEHYFRHNGTVVYRIRSLKKIGSFPAGTLGGYVESEQNLSQVGGCWIGGSAIVTEDARVSGDAQVGGYAEVAEFAKIRDEAVVDEYATVMGWATVMGRSRVSGSAVVRGVSIIEEAAHIMDHVTVQGTAVVFGNARITGKGPLEGEYRIFRSLRLRPEGVRGPINVTQNHKSFDLDRLTKDRSYDDGI